LSSYLSELLPLVVRLVLALLVFIVGVLCCRAAESALFRSSTKAPRAIRDGILQYTRHPLYLGVILIYTALFLTTLSLLTLVALVGVVLFHHHMARYEESELEQVFGEDYQQYKGEVSMWLPRDLSGFLRTILTRS
jgi:protein-S-isoprenylcysteine O-methyltransferase Ste14